MTDPVTTLAHDAGAVLADLVECLAAIGRSMQDEFDPRHFLEEFSAKVERLIPHDRLVIACRDDDSTFTIFAEHVKAGPVLHARHYTTGFSPEGRYPLGDGALRAMLEGVAQRLDDLRTDYRFAVDGSVEARVRSAGFRSALLLPLHSAGQVIGGLAASHRRPGAYTDAQLVTGRQIADLIAPFIQNIVLLQRERRRRRRLRALQGLPPALSASLNVRNVFGRLADVVRPLIDFDGMGACLLSASGRELEVLGEVLDVPSIVPTPPTMPLEHFSFSDRVVAGETVLLRDVTAELDPGRPGDRMIIADGVRSCLSVPLWFGERVGGALWFGKLRPSWFDAADAEIASGVAAQVVLVIQHQRLAEEHRRLAAVEGRARRLEERVLSLREALDERYAFEHIAGRAPSLREALGRAAKVAPTGTTVLLTGESGTGKEVVARAIHQASGRAEGPFVAVNCAALPEALLESELFGHERGAFTGADRQKPGRFELAAGGTLFLDEIAELTPGVQAKLLRVLQEREFQRVGGTATLRADARIVTATNRDLEREVAAGRFREDLFYRLDVFSVHLPPLRERGEDILLLADHFVRALGARMGKGEPGLSRDAREALLGHRWPGNIRELQNAVERALIVSEGGLITAAQLAITPPGGAPPRAVTPPVATPAGPASLAELEHRMVTDALDQARGNKSKAARLLGLTRAQLYTRLQRFGLR
ncbi:MAG: sigma 54-interacting transcriptional regulator [Candidatus Rokuibacteriota bacterium]